ncbi:MAG TPA: methyltransferase domain-containing protein, partial [Candidatus Tectomicrobia bacterium]|nr:methyltransferase domain-containing protein [Candidatus Tectomicrobia bacterium]
GNALALPFADGMFDIVIGQEAWVHVPDKGRLVAECARVLAPGGRIAFTDFLRTRTMQPTDLARLQPHWGQCFTPETAEGLQSTRESLPPPLLQNRA